MNIDFDEEPLNCFTERKEEWFSKVPSLDPKSLQRSPSYDSIRKFVKSARKKTNNPLKYYPLKEEEEGKEEEEKSTTRVDDLTECKELRYTKENKL